jgi:hypothetical protein
VRVEGHTPSAVGGRVVREFVCSSVQ